MKDRKTRSMIIAAAVLVILMGIVYYFNRPKAVQGEKHIKVEVKNESGTVTSYEEDTNAEYLAEALAELQKNSPFTYEAVEGPYGLYLISVNNEEADYNKTQTYWAVYVNGEYGSYGISEQPVADQDVYTLAVEK